MEDVLQCYKILGLEAGATAYRVRTSYLQLARFYDPERYRDDPDLLARAEKKRKEVEGAYQTIKHFLPELQDPKYRDREQPVQNRDFKEMSRLSPEDTAKMLMAALIGAAFVLIFAWGYNIYKETRVLPKEPSPAVEVDAPTANP